MNLVVYNAGTSQVGALGAAVGGDNSSHARRQVPVERLQQISSERVVAEQSATMSLTSSVRTSLVSDGKRNPALFDTENPIPYSNKLGIRLYEDMQQEADGAAASIFLSAVA